MKRQITRQSNSILKLYQGQNACMNAGFIICAASGFIPKGVVCVFMLCVYFFRHVCIWPIFLKADFIVSG